MPAKCQLHRRGSQIEPVPLNNGLWDSMPRGGGGEGEALSPTLLLPLVVYDVPSGVSFHPVLLRNEMTVT